jgi:small conductance mechanosensitive channel
MPIDRSRSPARLVVAVLLLLTGGLFETVAQGQTADDRSAALATRGAELMERFTEHRSAIEELKQQVAATEGEEQEILKRRLAEHQLEMLEVVGDQVKNALEQEEAGLDTTALRGKLDPEMLGLAQRASAMADAQREVLRDLRKQAADLSAEDQETFEFRFTRESDWLDRIHRACVDHLERMDSLKLDTDDFRAWLVQSLTQGADSLAGALELAAENTATTRARLADVPEDTTLQARLRMADARRDGAAKSLSETIALMRRIDLPTTRYQQVLIQATGDITTDVLDTNVALGLAGQWLVSLKEWALERGPELLFRAIVFGLVLLVFWLLARLVRKLVRRSVESSKLSLSKLLQTMIISFSGKAVLVLGLLLALSQVGVSLGPLLAGLGIAGFIIGFALQDTLSNFAAGMMILLYRPYDVGDLIEAAGGVFGKVSKMNLVSTTVLTLDHQTLVVPNSKIWGDVIKNVTAQRVRRVDLVFGISYEDDIPKTEKVLNEILQHHPKVLDDPEPIVRLHNLGDSSVDFVVRPWVATDDYWEVYWDVTREVKMRFDRENISIPFPQRDVHLYEETKASRKVAEAS